MSKALEGKIGLVFGVASKRSIAWAIAQAWADAGATLIFNYQGDRIKENVTDLVSSLNGEHFIAPCDVSKDEEIDSFYNFVRTKTQKVDFVLHSIAFAPKDTFEKSFLETSRSSFATALDVSAYSLIAVSRGAAPLMTEGGSITTLSYFAAEKVMPNYNVMAIAKAALEGSVRYLAYDLGPQKIRVNAISAGPVNTLAARGIAGFTKILNHYEEKAPLRRNIELEEVGNTALFLAAHGTGITGQTIYVDSGYSIMGW